MDFSDFSLIKLDLDTQIKEFNCGISEGECDLNNFLFSKSKHYHKELLATTYLLEDNNSTIAYFSIFNDALKVEEKNFASKSAFTRRIKDFVPHGKRHLEFFPAIKIGRLAVSSKIKKSGIGRAIISYVIDFAIKHNENCACKFITVDAYSQSIGFYQKLNFNFLTPSDEGMEERQMFLDLTPIINSY